MDGRYPKTQKVRTLWLTGELGKEHLCIINMIAACVALCRNVCRRESWSADMAAKTWLYCCHSHTGAYLDLARIELPLRFAVEGRNIHSPGDEAIPTAQGNGFQGPLDSIKDGGQQTGTQLH